VSAHSIANSRAKITGGLVAGVATSLVLTTAGLGLASTANATCASVFGLGNSADCTSTLFGAAIAIGNGAVAHANGLFVASIAVGTNSSATTSDALTLATAIGNNVTAGAHGLLSLAISGGGNNNTVEAGTAASIFNVAVNLLGSNNNVLAEGGLSNRAVNIGGNNNTVTTQGSQFNFARNILGQRAAMGMRRKIFWATTTKSRSKAAS
jgi:hypothetical protein